MEHLYTIPWFAWIPIVAIVGGIIRSTITGIVQFTYQHRERMEMIRHGLAPGPGLPGPGSGAGKDWGRVHGGQPLRGPAGPMPGDPVAAQRCLHRAIRLTCVGLAITVGLSFIGYHDGQIEPGPWLLGGLIPTFIGVAQIISAILSGATLRPPMAFGPPPPLYTVPPTEPSPTAPGPAPTYEGSYTYRPGSTQELRPPPPPLDRT